MAQTKSSKEMFVVNFREIPETICVETRFITKAGAHQKKDQTLYFMKVNRGQVELSKYEVPVTTAASISSPQLKNLPAIRSKPVTTVSVRNKPPTYVNNAPHSVIPSASLHSTQYATVPVPSQPQPITMAQQPPLGLAMSAPYNVTMLPESPNNICTVTTPLSTMTIPLPNTLLPSMNFNSPSLAMKKHVQTRNTACMTEPKPVYIHREQQTDIPPILVSTAIQCSMDDDFVNDLMEGNCEDSTTLPILPTEATAEEEKEKFLQFVKENSVEYKNHFRECLICGEVCKRSKYFYGHMLVHQGPKVLCFLCGCYLDHEALLKNHQCSSVTTKRVARALLRCPYKQCSIVAVSRLELYDHINEHKKYRVHKCSACQTGFCTAQEFLRHLLLRANCYTEAKRNRNRLYGLRSKADRLCRVRVFTLHSHSKQTAMVKRLLTGRRRKPKKNLCEICFRSYRNKYIFRRHIKKCGKRQQRFQKKQLSNGKSL